MGKRKGEKIRKREIEKTERANWSEQGGAWLTQREGVNWCLGFQGSTPVTALRK